MVPSLASLYLSKPSEIPKDSHLYRDAHSGAGSGLAWLGILGRSIIALFMVINTLELKLRKKMVDAHDAGIILGVIMVLVIGKFSWKIA